MNTVQARKVYLLKLQARTYNRNKQWGMLQSVIHKLESCGTTTKPLTVSTLSWRRRRTVIPSPGPTRRQHD